MSKMIENWGDTLVAIDATTLLFASKSGKAFGESMLDGTRVAGKQIEVPTIDALHPAELVTIKSIGTDEASGLIRAIVIGRDGTARHFRVVAKD